MLPPAPGDIPGLYAQARDLQKSGDGERAEAIYRRILLAAPAQVEVLFQLGRLLGGRGERAGAEALLRRARDARPTEAAVWQALHAVLDGPDRARLEREAQRAKVPLGLAEEAAPIFRLIGAGKPEEALRRAIALGKAAPVAAAPVHAVGAAYAALGNWAAAVPPLEAAATRAPQDAAIATDLARALFRAGRPLAALDRLDKAGAHGPDAAMLRAEIRIETCRPDLAAATLETAASGRAAPALFRRLAVARAALRDVSGALAAHERAGKGASPAQLAAALADETEFEAAGRLLDDALAKGPARPDLLVQRGQLRQTLGDLAAAEADLIRATEIAPDEAEAYRAYANGRKVGPDDPVATRLAARLARPDLPAAARRVMSFAAAKCSADRGDTAAEIAHLERANRLTAQAFPYSFAADLDIARQLAADWEALEPMAAADAPADPAIFITGLPRSGTTLAESILAAHPLVAAGGEMPFLSRALSPVMETLRAGRADPDVIAEAGRAYLAAARRRAGTDGIVADKAISTFSRIGHAAAALPGARFVVLRRDPRDTGLSLWRNMFPEGLHRYAYDQVHMARYIRLHEALVSFWAARLPDRVHILDYEALTADPEAEIRSLLAFCGLPWDDACLAPHKTGRSVATLSFAQVRQPIRRTSVAGWERFGDGLNALIGELGRTAPPDLSVPG